MADCVELKITGMGASMEGVAHLADGMAVFVPEALTGEIVHARIVKRTQKYACAELIDIIEKSSDRRRPLCPKFEQCGGCSIMHMNYQATLDCKARHICDCIERIGGVEKTPFGNMYGMDAPEAYRNRVQFPVGGRAGMPLVGFYRELTHEVIDLPDGCPMLKPKLNEARKIFSDWMREYKIEPYNYKAHRGLVRHAVFRQNHAGQFMAIAVINGRMLPAAEELWQRLRSIGCISLMLNILTDAHMSAQRSDVMSHEFICLYGKQTYIDEILGCKFELSAPSFFQINADMTDKLYSLALKAADLHDGQNLLDAYCGAGTIGLTLFKRSGIKNGCLTGIESVPEAIENAKRNAVLNDIRAAKFIRGKCEQEITKLSESGGCPDAAIIDPPRKGCDAKLLEALNRLSAHGLKRIVYVSCDPATLARDIKLMTGWGWRLLKVDGVDMFPWSKHVETVCLMSRKDA